MAEIRDGTVKEVLEKLRHLSYDIEEISKGFDTVDRTGDTLEDLRVRVYHRENEMQILKRQVERGSAPLPPQNQQAGTDRFPIPMYFGERSSLSRFLKITPQLRSSSVQRPAAEYQLYYRGCCWIEMKT